MINITFRPDKTKIRKDGKVQLYIHFTSDGKRTKVNLPLRIEIKYWSQSKQKALPKATHSTIINEQLIKYRQLAEGLYKSDMSLSEFRQLFVNAIGGNKTDTSLILYQYIDRYQKAHEGNYSKEYIRSFNSIKATIKLFNEKLRVDRVTYNDLSDYAGYLTNTRGLVDTTVNKQVTRLKTVLKYAKADGLNIDEKALTYTYKTSPSDSIALNESDIEKLKAATFDRADLTKQRDVLLFAIETGQRQSDRARLTKEDVKKDSKGRYYLEFYLTKGKAGKCIVPLSSLALKILKKYDFKLPIILEAPTSRSWKLICRMVGIRDVVKKEKYIGGKRIVETFKKCELVSTHTARTTFATRLYSKGMRIEKIQEMMGHKDIKTTRGYIKVDMDSLFDGFE